MINLNIVLYKFNELETDVQEIIINHFRETMTQNFQVLSYRRDFIESKIIEQNLEYLENGLPFSNEILRKFIVSNENNNNTFTDI